MKQFTRLVSGVLFGVLLAGCSTLCSRECASERSECIKLFNGENLDGFYTFLKGHGRNNDPNKVFTVDNGILRISGEDWGCLITEKAYENYHLIAEFKWGEETYAPREDRARDSGILLHSVGADGARNGSWMHSIECQVIEGGTGDFIVIGDGTDAFAITCTVAPEKQDDCHVYQRDGVPATIHQGRINWFGRDPAWTDVTGFRGKNDVEKPRGEWNHIECIVEGSTITNIVNGVTVNHATDVRPSKGKIQIQSEGAVVFFRRLDLIPLR